MSMYMLYSRIFVCTTKMFVLEIIFLLLALVSSGVKMSKTGLSPLDPSSFSRPELAVVTNLSITLGVNFAENVFSGTADLTVKKVQEDVNEIILDSKDLKINKIIETELDKPLNYTVGEATEGFGAKLTIELPPKPSGSYLININYATSPNASGLQWLSSEQTAGKKYPYVFSQFQAIHARSFVPCQDTPAVKTTYSALISAPNNYVVLMSAIRKEYKDVGESTVFHFEQDVPVPAYLIAVAIGVLEARRVGPRSHVWAEKEVVDAAAFEFADTEKQLATAEQICGPYVWGIYDLLVLPPSFPYGGMENPCLTFVTPTLLAGDKSLATVVAHEITHSWTGNLITNRNFEHFWLNEGFTIFVERKIKGRLENSSFQDFDAYLGLSELRETIERMGHSNPLTCLVVDLKGVDPDDAFSLVPYEKGQTFLRYLESVVGGPEKFEPFLKKYFDTFKYKSIDSRDFKKFFESYFKDDDLSQIDWETWLHKPGMPPVIPDYDLTLLKGCNEVKEKWINWKESEPIPLTAADFENLVPDQKIYLFQQILDLKQPQPVSKLKEIEKVFKLVDVKNMEIRFRWLRICLQAHWEEKLQNALDLVNEVGRMKYVRPIYRDLYAWEQIRARAIENFKKNRSSMMHVSAYTVAKDLHLAE